jgi:hypothetical protein
MVRVTCIAFLHALPFPNDKLLFCHCALALLKLINFRTSDQQLDLLLEANIEHKHATQQSRTNKNNTPIKRDLKKKTWFGSRIANARSAKNETIEGFILYYTRLCPWYILIQ